MDKSIGDLFRSYGEEYIKVYKPPLNHIKLIRAIRVCRTPALGGKRIVCKGCGATKHIYLSCGQTQCPLCQNRKRDIWQEKLSNKFLNVPYVHTVFTIPHELNPLARRNKGKIYNITMRAAWQTVKKLCSKPKYVGGLPGMVSVLHTFGSDMKYHIHVHALITFGGIDKDGQWVWPKNKKRLAPYRKISKEYRSNFLRLLQKDISKGLITEVGDMTALIEVIKNKRWNVRNEYPTADTEILEGYLARYINRIAISKSRLEFVKRAQKINDEVNISYKDYRNQVKGEAAPLAIKKVSPLVAINQFLSHVLPPYFQKSRHNGIHAANTYRRIKDKIPQRLKRNSESIKALFVILNHMNGQKEHLCEECQGYEFEILPLKADQAWIFEFVTIPSYRAPPIKYRSEPLFS